MHQLKHNKLPTSFDALKHMFFPTNNRFPTRQQELAQCSRFRTTFTSKIPFHKFTRLWNELLPVCHQITSTRIFKTKIQTSLLDSYSYKLHVTMTDANNVIQTYMYETLTENMSGMTCAYYESITLVYWSKLW